MNAHNNRTSVFPQGENFLRDLLISVFRRRRVVMVILVVAVTIATLLSMVMPRAYLASTSLIVDKNPPMILLSSAGQGSFLEQQPVSQAPDVFALSELAKSDGVAKAVTTRLATTFEPGVISNILSSLRVQEVQNTEILRISVEAGSPRIAALVANAVAESVVETDLTTRRRLATQAREFIGDQLNLTGRKLRNREDALVAFRNKYGDVSLSDETQLNLRKLAGLEDQLLGVQLQKGQIENGLGQAAGPSGQAEFASTRGTPDPVIGTLQSQLANLEIEYSGLQKQFTLVHPQVISTQAKIEETKRRLSAEIARSRGALETQQRGITTAIDQVEQQLREVPTREATLARMVRDAKDAERTYTLLSERFQEARITEGSIGSAIRVMDPAQVPEQPVRPKRRLNMMMGALIGLVAGVAAALGLDVLDDTIRNTEDLERRLGKPVLGTIPPLAMKDTATGGPPGKALPLITQWQSTGEADAFRVLRTHILRALTDIGGKCLMLTSAGPREGKSIIAANLAIAVGQTQRRVTLVECNLRYPTLASAFPEASSPGLSEVLAGQMAMDEVIRPTKMPYLGCVVSSSPTVAAAELLETNRMAQFLALVRKQSEVVLLDGPPVLPNVDAEAVGPQADGAVLVVQVGTRGQDIVQACLRLERSGVRVLGMVINSVAKVTRSRTRL